MSNAHVRSDSLPVDDVIHANSDCPICLNTNRKIVSNIGRNLQKLTTVICTNCGLLHSDPIPSEAELEVFYAESYRSKYKGCRQPKLKHLIRYAPDAYLLARRIYAKSTCSTHRWLDIGSGSGEFLYMAKLLGVHAEGVEPNKGYAEYTANELGLTIQNCTYDKASLNKASYSAINLNHVLEHMRDPFGVLAYIKELLMPGGILAVAVPDGERMSHAPWTQFHYAHIYNFNHATLKALLMKAGFEVIGGKETSLIAVKRGPSDVSLSVEIPENFQLLWEKLNSHSPTAHFRSSRPYSRFLRKCQQYPLEWFLSLRFRTPKRALESIFKELERKSIGRICNCDSSLTTYPCATSCGVR